MVALEVVLDPQVRQNLLDFDEGWMRDLVNSLLQEPLSANFSKQKSAKSIALIIRIMSWHGDGFPLEWSPEATRDLKFAIEVRKTSGEAFESRMEWKSWIDKGQYHGGFAIYCTKTVLSDMRLNF